MPGPLLSAGFTEINKTAWWDFHLVVQWLQLRSCKMPVGAKKLKRWSLHSLCDQWQHAQHELCGQVVRCLGWLAPEPCLRAQVEVGRSGAAQVEETEAPPMPWWCRNLNTGEEEGLCCASGELGCMVRTLSGVH